MRRTSRSVVVDFAELSDPGRDPAKQVNEDSSGYAETPLGHLAVVCDGMGGHARGREASQTAVQVILEAVQRTPAGAAARPLLANAVRLAGSAVHALGGDMPSSIRPGSTCVLALVSDAGALIAHVGDSRALLVRGVEVKPLTRDHSLVEQLLASGVLTPERAANHPEANRITRALGMNPNVEVEVSKSWIPLQRGDVMVLATDGLTDLVEDDDLRTVVRSQIALGPAVVAQQLVELANARGGHDNITVQILHVLELPRQPRADTLPIEPDADETAPQMLAGQWGYDEDSAVMTVPEPLRRALAAAAGDRPAETVVDAPALGAPPLDGGERTTEPGPQRLTSRPPARVPWRPSVGPSPRFPAWRVALLVGSTLVLAMVAAILLRRAREQEDQAPLPVPTLSETPRPPVELTLEPSPEPTPPASDALPSSRPPVELDPTPLLKLPRLPPAPSQVRAPIPSGLVVPSASPE